MHVTVCICTRDRGASIVQTVESLKASTYADFDVIVVDQNSNNETEGPLLDCIESDARFRYVRSEKRGASAGRNTAMEYARGPIVAFTDDDCDVSPEWLERLVTYFLAYSDVAEICGPVLAAPHDSSAGFIPIHAVKRLQKLTSPWMKWHDHGISANMAFRRETLDAVGGWDEVLGTGAPLFACTDGDITYRTLRAGFAVLHVPDATVEHRGFRSWQQGRPMMRRVGIGIGATYMKHLRLGDIAVVPTLLIEWVRSIQWSRLFLLRKRTGVARFVMYAVGMCRSFEFPVDPVSRTYVPRRVAPLASAAQTADSESVPTSAYSAGSFSLAASPSTSHD